MGGGYYPLGGGLSCGYSGTVGGKCGWWRKRRVRFAIISVGRSHRYSSSYSETCIKQPGRKKVVFE